MKEDESVKNAIEKILKEEGKKTGSKKIKRDELKVAIVCDWLTNVGGAEKVLLEIHNLLLVPTS